MKIKEIIEIAEKKAGSQINLSKIIGQKATNLRAVKRGTKKLPTPICIILANYISQEPAAVIAANNLNTEKREERRKIYQDLIEKNQEDKDCMYVS